MPRRTDNGQNGNQDNSPKLGGSSQLWDQAEAIETPTQDYSTERSESGATTSPDPFEEVTDAIVEDLLNIREQVWGSVAKKLRAALLLDSPIYSQPSILDSRDGLPQEFSTLEAQVLPPTADS